MANISQFLKKIKEAIYGEEVRGSIHDAIDAINKDAVSAVDDASSALNAANNAVSKANDIGNRVGALSDLTTEIKNSIVAAINWINSNKIDKIDTIRITDYPTSSSALDDIYPKAFNSAPVGNVEVGVKDFTVYLIDSVISERIGDDDYYYEEAGLLFVSSSRDDDSVSDYIIGTQVYINNTGEITYRTCSEQRKNLPDSPSWGEWKHHIPKELGSVSNLVTDNKTTLVGAVNEVANKMGDLKSLKTENKSTAIAAINELWENDIPCYDYDNSEFPLLTLSDDRLGRFGCHYFAISNDETEELPPNVQGGNFAMITIPNYRFERDRTDTYFDEFKQILICLGESPHKTWERYKYQISDEDMEYTEWAEIGAAGYQAELFNPNADSLPITVISRSGNTLHCKIDLSSARLNLKIFDETKAKYMLGEFFFDIAATEGKLFYIYLEVDPNREEPEVFVHDGKPFPSSVDYGTMQFLVCSVEVHNTGANASNIEISRGYKYQTVDLREELKWYLEGLENKFDSEIDGSKIAPNTIDGDKIASNSITGGKAIETPGDPHVTTNGHIAVRTITGDNIDYSTIKGENIGNKEIKTANIDDKGVATAKIADKAVGTAQIADKAVGTAQIADKAITGQQIETKTITNMHMNDGAIQEYAIADRAVTSRKIAAGVIPEKNTQAFSENATDDSKYATPKYVADAVKQTDNTAFKILLTSIAEKYNAAIVVDNSVTIASGAYQNYISPFTDADGNTMQVIIYAPNATSIRSLSIRDNTHILSILAPKLQTIYNNAFWGAHGVEFLYIPNTIRSIDASAFPYCEKLKTIYIDKSKDSIPNSPWSSYSTNISNIYWLGGEV